MNTFRIKAYAKINLGLDVLRRRPDGYHEVKMIMQTVDLYDDLEFTKLAEDEIRIFTDKEELPADQGNLIWRAAARMKELYQISEGVSVKLTKRIPIAAGMAGGSADAAATIHAMDALFCLGLSLEEKQKIGVKLGADPVLPDGRHGAFGGHRRNPDKAAGRPEGEACDRKARSGCFDEICL